MFSGKSVLRYKSVKITIVSRNVPKYSLPVRQTSPASPLAESFNYREHIAIKGVKGPGPISRSPLFRFHNRIHAYLLSNTPLRFGLIAINPRFMNIYCNSGDCLEEDIFTLPTVGLQARAQTHSDFNRTNNANKLRVTAER